ncbi:MAG: hypothetical protein AAB351_01530 [Patescibacteria group bacterium]
MFKKVFAVVFSFITIFAPFSVVLADFNPNKLIEDKTFSDIQTFGSALGIQQFLDSKKSILANTNVGFLQKLREPTDVNLKTNLSDPEANLGRLRSAAELIWDASVKTGINPQVIIVTLQKEQSLITGAFLTDSKIQSALDHAMGFGCPDSGGCDSLFFGFYPQLFGAYDAQGNKYIGAPGSLMRSFTTPNGRGPGVDAQNQTFGTPIIRTSKINDIVSFKNTTGGPQNPQAFQTVTLSNAATAALYRYTPHVYNGNYNFWKFFDQWFKYPNGTLIKLSSDSTTYIINNGLKSVIPNFVILSRGLNAGSTITVSPTELSSLDQGPIYGPADNTVIKVSIDPSEKLFVFANSEKHPVSAFVLKQRGLKAESALSVTQAEADLFATMSLLPPKDGTLIQGDASKAVYIIKNGKRMSVSAFTFKQYAFKSKDVNRLTQSEVDGYTLGDFLLPKDGTLVKTKDSSMVFLIQSELLRPISTTVFKLHKFQQSKIVTLTINELAAANLGSFLPPPENTYFRLPDGSVFLYSNGSKHYVSAFVFKQRNIKPVAMEQNEGMMLNDGLPLPPKDGTLIKGDKSQAIYAITKGLKVGLDAKTWTSKYKKQKPNVLSQAEVDSYPAPSDIEQ